MGRAGRAAGRAGLADVARAAAVSTRDTMVVVDERWLTGVYRFEVEQWRRGFRREELNGPPALDDNALSFLVIGSRYGRFQSITLLILSCICIRVVTRIPLVIEMLSWTFDCNIVIRRRPRYLHVMRSECYGLVDSLTSEL